MANYPGPYEIRLFYTTNEPVTISSHVLRLSLRLATDPSPGTPFDAIQTLNKAGSPGNFLFADLTDLLTVVRGFYVSAVDFVRAELWRYPPQSFDALFVSAQSLGIGGTGTGTTQIAGQLIFTFRTSLGGIMKVDMRGTTVAPREKLSFPTAFAAFNNLANYFLLPNTPFIGRDNGVPIATLYALAGQNERAWKRVYR